MTGALRKWGPWALLLAVAIAVLSIGLHPSGHPSLEARTQSIASQVRCPVCNGETVAQSQAAPAVEILSEIRKDLQAGESKNQILAGLVQSYGPSILEKPQSSGFDLLIWVLPVVVVVFGGGGLFMVLRRWQRRAAAGLPGTDDAGVGGDGSGTGADPVSDTPVSPDELAAGADLSAPAAASTGGGSAAGGVSTAVGGPAAASVPASAAAGSGAVATAVIDGPPAGPTPSRGAQAVANGTGADGPGAELPGAHPGGADESGSRPPGAAPVAGPPGEGASGRRRRRGGVRWSTRTRWAATGAVLAVVAAGASWAVAASSGTRLPGESITGQVLPDQQVATDLQDAATAAQKSDVVGALKDYEKVLKVEPKQVEALTGMGWLLAQTGQPSLLQEGLSQLAAAERAQPSYAPAHLYRGISLLGEGNYAASVPELQWYLDHNPDPQLVSQVRKALTQAQAGLAATKAAGKPVPSSGAKPAGG